MTVSTRETGSSLQIRDEQETWTPQQAATLRQLGLEGASDGDLQVYFHQCQRTGLDPFARQIHMIGRNSKNWKTDRWEMKYTIQTGIDGFRLIGRRAADAKHERIELSDTEWCGEDGVWRDVWLSQQPPAAARVAVIRDGGRFPAVALFSEYKQTTKQGGLTSMWRDKPSLMLGKCAEALAWRKAFPQDLSGIYTSDEMGAAEHAEHVEIVTQEAPQIAPSTSIEDALADGDWNSKMERCNTIADLRQLYEEAQRLGLATSEFNHAVSIRKAEIEAEEIEDAMPEQGDKR